MAGVAIITEACIGVKDRACVDVCPVQCIYEYDPVANQLVSEEVAGSGVVETAHTPNRAAVEIFGSDLLYVNLDECTSCRPELYFSHRRDEGRTGRQGVIARVES